MTATATPAPAPAPTPTPPRAPSRAGVGAAVGALAYPLRLYRRFSTPVAAADFERPADHGLRPESFEVETSDRVVVRGWAFTPAAPWGVVILTHARSASKSRVLRQARLLYGHGLAVVTFDFRGCGESGATRRPGGNSLRAPLRDLEAVARYVRRRYADDPLLASRTALMGCSFGGNMAIAHAGTAGRHYPAVILDSTPLVRWQDMLRELLRTERRASRSPRLHAAADRAVIRAVVLRTGAGALYRQAVRSARGLHRTKLMYIVGERDTFFDVDEGCRFLDLYYAGPREVWRVRRGRHLTNHLVDEGAYGERIVAFLRSAFPEAEPSESRTTTSQEPSCQPPSPPAT